VSKASESWVEVNFNKNEIGIDNDSLSSVKNATFIKKYNSLVFRAYFKIIVEAERADIRLGKEYKRMYSAYEANTLSSESEEKFVKTYKKFLAHRRMLKGLKSWRIFSEYRTGDLEYFKAENHNEILKMHQRGSNEQTMIKVLMYKLADLYHFGE
jgi:hypothetical protein